MRENRKFRKCVKILGVTAAVYGVFRFLLPLVAPFVFAWLTALMLKPLAYRLSGAVRIPWRGRCAGLPVGAAGLLELAVLLGVGGTAVSLVGGAVGQVSDRRLPPGGRSSVS